VVRPSFNCLCGVCKPRLSSTCCRGRCLTYSLWCWMLRPLSTGVRLPFSCRPIARTATFLICCLCVCLSCSLLSYCYMEWLCSSPNTCCCYVTVALVFSSSAGQCHLIIPGVRVSLIECLSEGFGNCNHCWDFVFLPVVLFSWWQEKFFIHWQEIQSRSMNWTLSEHTTNGSTSLVITVSSSKVRLLYQVSCPLISSRSGLDFDFSTVWSS